MALDPTEPTEPALETPSAPDKHVVFCMDRARPLGARDTIQLVSIDPSSPHCPIVSGCIVSASALAPNGRLSRRLLDAVLKRGEMPEDGVPVLHFESPTAESNTSYEVSGFYLTELYSSTEDVLPHTEGGVFCGCGCEGSGDSFAADVWRATSANNEGLVQEEAAEELALLQDRAEESLASMGATCALSRKKRKLFDGDTMNRCAPPVGDDVGASPCIIAMRAAAPGPVRFTVVLAAQ